MRWPYWIALAALAFFIYFPRMLGVDTYNDRTV